LVCFRSKFGKQLGKNHAQEMLESYSWDRLQGFGVSRDNDRPEPGSAQTIRYLIVVLPLPLPPTKKEQLLMGRKSLSLNKSQKKP
jgi:hypothetical protein